VEFAGVHLSKKTEVAEVMAVGRWFQSHMVWGKKELNRTG